MSRRRIGQEVFEFAQDSKNGSTLDALSRVIDWVPSDGHLAVISSAAEGEPAYPKTSRPSQLTRDVVASFDDVADRIDSEEEGARLGADERGLSSNQVQRLVGPALKELGFEMENSGKRINVPVLYGRNGRVEKAFRADGWQREERVVIEVEAGRAVTNYQFLKDIFQACMMDEIDGLIIAVRKVYKGSSDFNEVCKFMDTMYASGRLILPLKTLVVIGY